MISIKSNMPALNANRQFKVNFGSSAKSMEKLSSGYRINRAADDAAGLSISEKMRRQIRGLAQASANAQDGISLVQSAEGALNEVHDILHRANELAVKAANETLTDDDRILIDEEIQQLKAEIDTSSKHSVFNELRLFPDNGYSPRTSARAKAYHYDLSFDLTKGTIQVDGLANGAAGIGRAAAGDVSTGNVLADTIANVMVPNAINQILNAFPSIKAAVGSNTINMGLDVSFLDGPNNTLAYASFTYKPNGGPPTSLTIKVDISDFSNADAEGTGSRAEALESTIAHELMHSVMQYTMTDGMSGRTGQKYSTWFVEGTAQLAGGGFPTGWNDRLESYAGKLSDDTDTSQDGNIKKYLQSYTVSGRPYGHGYLAAAYVGYLASGSGNVTGADIAAGMDKIFDELIKGSSLNDALKKYAGITESDLINKFKNGDNDVVEFVRKLSVASLGGAGSVIAADLSTGGKNILGDTEGLDVPFKIDPSKVRVDLSGAAKISLQVGAEARQRIDIDLYQMSAEALGLADTNVKTALDAGDAINSIKAAIGYVSNVRSAYGAIQNRLEHTITNLDNITENTTASESAIRDTDMAEEMVQFSNQQILLQAGQSILAQANHQPEMLLSLLS